MSAIQFGVVIPQGWSYDFHLLDKMHQEEKMKLMQLTNIDIQKISEWQLTNAVQSILFIHTITFFHIMLLTMKKISLNVLLYCQPLAAVTNRV
jgi:hypothetical protein